MERQLAEWLNAAGRVPLLSPEQEILLGRQVQAAQGLPASGLTPEQKRAASVGLRSRRRLVEANLRLVYRIVSTAYKPLVTTEQLLDLLQVGAEGAFHAAGKFQPERGTRFTTYASIWVRWYCQQEMSRMGHPIRPPTTIAPQLRKISKATTRLRQSLGRPPTIEELSEDLGLSYAETRLALERRQRMVSLNTELVEGWSLEDTLAAPVQPNADPQEMLATLNEWGLDDLESLCVLAAHGFGMMSVTELAQAEGLTEREVWRLARLAAKRLEPIPG